MYAGPQPEVSACRGGHLTAHDQARTLVRFTRFHPMITASLTCLVSTALRPVSTALRRAGTALRPAGVTMRRAGTVTCRVSTVAYPVNTVTCPV